MVKIDEYLRDAKCIIGRSLSLANPPCDGKLEYFSDDTQDTLLNAANMLRWLTNYRFERESVGELVDIIADDLQCWMEGEQSPQEMGWAGQDGQP